MFVFLLTGARGENFFTFCFAPHGQFFLLDNLLTLGQLKTSFLDAHLIADLAVCRRV